MNKEDDLLEAFVAGFSASAEGYNGECINGGECLSYVELTQRLTPAFRSWMQSRQTDCESKG
jgi:hypothetical protein